jgi:hypothetical protein
MRHATWLCDDWPCSTSMDIPRVPCNKKVNQSARPYKRVSGEVSPADPATPIVSGPRGPHGLGQHIDPPRWRHLSRLKKGHMCTVTVLQCTVMYSPYNQTPHAKGLAPLKVSTGNRRTDNQQRVCLSSRASKAEYGLG